jgi:hypothetical protein
LSVVLNRKMQISTFFAFFYLADISAGSLFFTEFFT